MRLPKIHTYLISVLVVAFALLCLNQYTEPPSKSDESLSPTLDSIVANEQQAIGSDLKILKHTIRAGESLASIFKKYDYESRDLYLLTQSEYGTALKSIYPKQELSFLLRDRELIQVKYSTNPLQSYIFDKDGDNFRSNSISLHPDRFLERKHGVIENSLFLSSQSLGLSDNLIMRFAQIFQWDVDFVLDIRPGDAFSIVFESLYLNGKRVGDGEILAATFINQGRSFEALAYATQDNRLEYFTPVGKNMRKAFLRAPLEFSRISSNFNPRRRHPLFKTVIPHRGIDYAAPSGTPVFASGDGKVIEATRTKANGKFIVISHGEQFVTKYLHLSNFANRIKKGKRVKQGQTIGYVGSTGYATGPHLHYEFLVNGVHRNPRTVELPKAASIPPNQLESFLYETERNRMLLASQVSSNIN
ncbi:MAG: peptidoglycan DD-metalloendopeptidase family protein [Pseudomonadota bacterium]|nr:peptidoglycan DD-metalloendopeptidase family protein [Pseudomonadota bacterium]